MRLSILMVFMAIILPMMLCDKISTLVQYTRTSPTNAGCISFTPLTPSVAPGQNCGAASIDAAHVDALLEKIKTDTPFRCLQMYGLTPQAILQAKAKGFKVIVVLFLSTNIADNGVVDQAISIANHPDYRDTIIG